MTMKEMAVYITLSAVTMIVTYVWAKISLDRKEIVDLPYPIIAVLLLGWGLKVPQELISLFTP